ncbi:hypothetical protein [Streptomyces anulatus]|uniref:hypothetical protein n=1 Tax=Streptomyces anulatus TaxID=1892 RepID=UPI0033D1037D
MLGALPLDGICACSDAVACTVTVPAAVPDGSCSRRKPSSSRIGASCSGEVSSRSPNRVVHAADCRTTICRPSSSPAAAAWASSARVRSSRACCRDSSPASPRPSSRAARSLHCCHASVVIA